VSVTAVRELGAYRVLEVSDPDGPVPAAGQFAMLAAAERWGAGVDERPHLPRAFSYARWRAGEAHFLLEDVGPGTRRLGELGVGERLWMLGPLGRGFIAPSQGPPARRALLVGGGVGIAPLAIWQDALLAGGVPCTAMLGFRDGAHAQGAALLGEATLSSDDGSVGRRGQVTDLLHSELQRDPNATVYACGPPAMLEAVRALCAELAVPAQLALEAGMACGFGACYGCVLQRRGGGYLRVCMDGPVIDLGELDRVEAYAGSDA
jgi:NAD(P)H-flavin reductase